MNKSSSAASNGPRMFYCETCRIACGGQATYQAHLNGSKHKKKETNAQTSQNPTVNSFRCELCDITCTNADAYKAHLEGSKHDKVKARREEKRTSTRSFPSGDEIAPKIRQNDSRRGITVEQFNDESSGRESADGHVRQTHRRRIYRDHF